MGCDIHFFVEDKESDGTWVAKNVEIPAFKQRNYYVFALLADVRNSFPFYIKQIKAHNGVPLDVSEDVKKWYYKNVKKDEKLCLEVNGNYHSAHWMTIKELSEINLNAPLVDYLDCSGYNMDYDGYPEVLMKYFKKREPMSQEEVLLTLSIFCPGIDMNSKKEITLADFFGEKYLKDINHLIKNYPNGRIIYYFDN